MMEDPLNSHRVQSTSERFQHYFARRIEESDVPEPTTMHSHSEVDSENRNPKSDPPTGSDPPTKKARLASDGVGPRNRGMGIPLSSTPPKRARIDCSIEQTSGDSTITTPSQSSSQLPTDDQHMEEGEQLLLDMLFVSGVND